MDDLKTLNGSDEEMIASILAGEMQLYHDLIRPHERSVYQMALSYMKNKSDADATPLSERRRSSVHGLSVSP